MILEACASGKRAQPHISIARVFLAVREIEIQIGAHFVIQLRPAARRKDAANLRRRVVERPRNRIEPIIAKAAGFAEIDRAPEECFAAQLEARPQRNLPIGRQRVRIHFAFEHERTAMKITADAEFQLALGVQAVAPHGARFIACAAFNHLPLHGFAKRHQDAAL